MLRLIVRRGQDRGKVLELTDGDSFLVGRGSDTQLQLNDPSSSREHFIVERVDDGWELVDLDSNSGTRVNGEPVESCLLADGDRIRFGLTEIEFGEKDVQTWRRFVRLDIFLGSMTLIAILVSLLIYFFLPSGTYFLLHRDSNGSIQRIEFIPDGKPKLDEDRKVDKLF